MSAIRNILRQRDSERERAAFVVATEALSALDSAGHRARLVGSLARGEFRSHSDVDILIDASGPARDVAIEVCLRALKGHPCSILFVEDVPEATLAHLIGEATDGPRLRVR